MNFLNKAGCIQKNLILIFLKRSLGELLGQISEKKADIAIMQTCAIILKQFRKKLKENQIKGLQKIKIGYNKNC